MSMSELPGLQYLIDPSFIPQIHSDVMPLLYLHFPSLGHLIFSSIVFPTLSSFILCAHWPFEMKKLLQASSLSAFSPSFSEPILVQRLELQTDRMSQIFWSLLHIPPDVVCLQRPPIQASPGLHSSVLLQPPFSSLPTQMSSSHFPEMHSLLLMQ